MAYLIECSGVEIPCDAAHQVVLASPDLSHLAQLGVTPESVGTAVLFGFGVVFLGASLGLAVNSIVKVIRAL